MKRLLLILFVWMMGVTGAYAASTPLPPTLPFNSVAVLQTSNRNVQVVSAQPQVRTFYSVASSRTISVAGARTAPQLAASYSRPRKLGGLNPPVIDDGPTTDPENPDLPQPPVPLGDSVIFLLLLSAAFAFYKRRRKTVNE